MPLDFVEAVSRLEWGESRVGGESKFTNFGYWLSNITSFRSRGRRRELFLDSSGPQPNSRNRS